jgi:hypothetical protein
MAVRLWELSARRLTLNWRGWWCATPTPRVPSHASNTSDRILARPWLRTSFSWASDKASALHGSKGTPGPRERTGRSPGTSPSPQAATPENWGTKEIPSPPKKSFADRARDLVARVAARIHWRSAVFLRRILKRRSDPCWFCTAQRRRTRSHVLLHCNGDRWPPPARRPEKAVGPLTFASFLRTPRWEARPEVIRGRESSGQRRRRGEPGSVVG